MKVGIDSCYEKKCYEYHPEIGRFINADTEMADAGEVQGHNLFQYCFNNPVNLIDGDGQWPSWATKVLIGTAVIAALAVVTVATAGTGTVLAVATGALQGAVTGAAVGAASGAAIGAVSHRVTTGSWQGAGRAALEGAADGYMWGAITGFVTGGISQGLPQYARAICFTAGTPVLTANGYVAIETIKAGDMVWSENVETGEKELKPVVQTFVNETNEIVHIYTNGEKITATPEHPFWVSERGWIGAIYLRAGDHLPSLQNGEHIIVERIQHELLNNPIPVYNFEVQDFHTYFVSNSCILVHNTCSPLKGKDAVDAAGKLGFKATSYLSKGQKVFYNAKTKMYITADIDMHNGGVWKMAKTIEGLASKATRLGTYDKFLNWIGK